MVRQLQKRPTILCEVLHSAVITCGYSLTSARAPQSEGRHDLPGGKPTRSSPVGGLENL